MRPPTTRQGRQCSGQKGSTALQNPELAQNDLKERPGPEHYGAMLTPAIQQLSEVGQEGLSHLPPNLAGGQSARIVFYDPIAFDGSDELTQARPSHAAGAASQDRRHRKAAKGKQGTRAESIEAVARELAALALRNQGRERPGVIEETHAVD